MTAFTRSLDDLIQLLDAPTRKTSTGVGTDSHAMTDSIGSFVTKAPFDDLMGLSDDVAVTKFTTAEDLATLTDAGSFYAKALIGEDTVGLTDEAPVVLAGPGGGAAALRTVNDPMSMTDTDRPLQQGWASTVDDTEGLRDTKSQTSTSSNSQTLEDLVGLDDETPILSRSLVFDDAMGLTHPAPTVVQTHSTFFTTTIESPVGLTDNNLGDNAGFIIVSKVSILPAIQDKAYLRDSLTAVLSANDFTFEGPTVEEGPAGGDPLFYYYRLTRGITVVQDPDTTWRMVRFPTSEELAAALTVYRGGYTYDLTLAQAQALTAAGFSAFVVPAHDPVTVTVPENPIP